jgi:photosystem II stability/assembly factor-like uncharacterized protein
VRRRWAPVPAILLALIGGCGSSIPSPAATDVVPQTATMPAPLGTDPIRFAGFASATVGWAVTTRGLWLTADDGASWRSVGPPVDFAANAPKGAAFFDNDRGWVVSEDAFSNILSLWRTADGGANWSRIGLPGVPIPPETMGEAQIEVIDAEHAVVDVAGGMPNGYLDGLLETADGGSTWTAAAMQPPRGADGITGLPAFIDPRTGWLAGGAPGTRLWVTRDGGQTWQLQHLAVPTGYADDEGEFPGAPRFFGPTDGVVARRFDNNVTAITVIYRTNDAGATWKATGLAVPPASSLSFVTADDWIAWSAAAQRWWQSSDQGQTWSEPRSAVGLPRDGSPTYVDPDHAWGAQRRRSDRALSHERWRSDLDSDGSRRMTARRRRSQLNRRRPSGPRSGRRPGHRCPRASSRR